MRAPRLLDKEFAGFMEAVGLSGASDIQRQEMRKAFFAGARAFWTLIEANTEGGDGATDQDMALMEALQAEMDAFLNDLKASASAQ